MHINCVEREVTGALDLLKLFLIVLILLKDWPHAISPRSELSQVTSFQRENWVQHELLLDFHFPPSYRAVSICRLEMGLTVVRIKVLRMHPERTGIVPITTLRTSDQPGLDPIQGRMWPHGRTSWFREGQ